MAPDLIDNRAYGYSPTFNGLKEARSFDSVALSAAGSLHSTGADLARWITALHSGKLLTSESLKEMTTPNLEGYGYGLRISEQYGFRDIGHEGDLPGFHASTEYFPETKTVIVILTNVRTDPRVSSVTPGSYSIDNELMALACNPLAIVKSTGKEFSVSPEVLQTYIGEYQLQETPPSQHRSIVLRGGKLAFSNQLTDNSALYLRAESPTRFYFEGPESEVEFSKDTQGNQVMMIFNYTLQTASRWVLTSR
jgi:hypothetical protein